MLTLKSRKKTLGIISILWILIFLSIFQISRYLYTSGFKNLEISFAKESNQRAYEAMLSELKHIYLLNLDYAYWDETYDYINDQNKNYSDKNLIMDLFEDNNINYVLLVNKNQQIIWGKGYSLIDKKYIALPTFLTLTLINSLSSDIKSQYRAYDVSEGKHGLAGFYRLPQTGEIIYLAINQIYSSDKKDTNGYLIFAKILDKSFFQELSDKINYPIKLKRIQTFLADPKNSSIYDFIKVKNQIYISELNKQFLQSYRLFYDLVGKPIGILSVDLSRDLYLESEKASHENQILIFCVSVVAIIFMLLLIYLFFNQQDRITKAFEQFFPKNFIKLLNKEDVLSVALGDSVEKEITILFLDIRNFTLISEEMTPTENFKFINDVLGYIAPIVAINHGFIDKYIGDAVMALFPSPKTHANDAVNTALMMIESLKQFKKEKGLNIKFEVSVGIGINTGKLMLGIIGASGRIEATVISDAVNTASRIESATKNYDCPILISQNTVDQLVENDNYEIYFVDELVAKGKSKKIPVYSVRSKLGQ